MESSDLAFKAIAILNTVAGYVLFALAANEDIQESCFYRGVNPLLGEIRKYMVYYACWSLIACGIFAFFMPKFAVYVAWLSVVLYLLTGLIPLVAGQGWPSFCKTCTISLGIRVIAAAALTGLC